jgi:anti-sigma factor RsiW
LRKASRLKALLQVLRDSPVPQTGLPSRIDAALKASRLKALLQVLRDSPVL